MKIRFKLALLWTVGITAATLSSAFVFLQLQRTRLRATQAENSRLLLESIARIGNESQLAKDPLMLLDYLAFIRRDRPEIHHCRVRFDSKWQEIGELPAREPERGVSRQFVHVPFPGGPPGKGSSVEVHFSRDVLHLREQEAFEAILRNMLKSSLVVILVGILLSFPLSRTFTRRIVLIEKALESIGQGRLGEHVQARGSDEIARLAKGVNAMSERLKELDELKRTFVASVTHELRSPLGAIESHVQNLLATSPSLSEEDKKTLQRIRASSLRLGHFVNNLLEMAKIERGKLDFAPRPVNMAELVEDTVIFFGPKAKEAGLQLDFDVDKDLPLVRLDPDLISQVLTNFISNAIKFTRPGGRIRVTAHKASQGEGPALQCAVLDTGVGIPEEALHRIFKPFERVKNPLRANGAGLGLAISKSILDIHGGSIGAQSEVGKGSRFYFVLPLGNGKGKGAA